MRRWAMTGLGLGYAPVASGTFGSAGAVAIALLCWIILAGMDMVSPTFSIIMVVFTLLSTLGCGYWGNWAIQNFAAKKAGDPGMVVLDEYAGQWIALVALPMVGWQQVLVIFAVQFFLFRLFDVFKPPPANWLEKLPAGWGIVADDLAAGIYANIVGQIIFRWLWGF